MSAVPNAAPPISYQLLIEVARASSVPIGRFGLCHFPAGFYLYTGSARRNLEARIARHQTPTKKLRWHIDWLLTAPGVRIVEVRCFAMAECTLNQATGGQVVVPGFGASDCRAGCGSHLKWLGGKVGG